jgi:phosphoribosylglycinamide formyltransferase-1
MAPMPSKLPIAVLISGSGTNLQALLDAADDPAFHCGIVGVISDRADAAGLGRATASGVPTSVVHWSDFDSRKTFTDAIVEAAQGFGAEALVLAGFMRILAPAAVASFPNRIINVHPALLPQFPGANAIDQALEAGVDHTGVTVHFVDELVDHGPIIAAEPVPIHDGDDHEVLRVRIQAVEHRLLPEVVDAFGAGSISVAGTTVTWRQPTHRVTT